MPRRKSPPPDTERLVTLREARERKQARKRLEGLAEERRAKTGRQDMATREARAQAEADAWNNAHPVGCDVLVTRDGGEVLETITRASAAVVGAAAVIWVVGIVGCYALERVRAVDAMVVDGLEVKISGVVTLPEDVAVGQRYEVRGEVWEVTAIGVDGTQAAAVVKLDAAGERTATTDAVWYGELRTEARLIA